MQPGPAALDRPVPALPSAARWGSDAIALTLRGMGVPYVALNPGASYRGLHDSLVNLLGNSGPQLLLCLHEEHAVAVAHGYAKVTGQPMAALLHSNVGLMHATMAVFNAWCDRMPVLVLGADGPIDADLRRPWIDWIHTTADTAALVRPFVKWDNRPGSVPAACEALLRAGIMARTAPPGPVYLCIDAALQEAPWPTPHTLPNPARHQPAATPDPPPDTIQQAARLLQDARYPVILAGRMARTDQAWADRVALAERLGAIVLSDQKVGAVFPTHHPLHPIPQAVFLRQPGLAALHQADVILSLDWIDLAGTLRAASADGPVTAQVIHASCDILAHNGWSMDHQALPPVDVPLLSAPERCVKALLAALCPAPHPAGPVPERPSDTTVVPGPLSLTDVAIALRRAAAGRDVTLIRVATGWPAEAWPLRAPLDFLGGDGGGGVGSGPGLAVGAALALLDTGRLPVAVLGDGDTLMGINALWTAARYRIPSLILVANNGSFFNDEVHQDRIARLRGRPPENRGIGQHIADPIPDIAGLARAQGWVGLGPVATRPGLAAALAEAVEQLQAGHCVLVDVTVPGTQAGAAGRTTAGRGLAEAASSPTQGHWPGTKPGGME